MKCQFLFSRKIKKNIVSLWSAEFAYSMVSIDLLGISAQVRPRQTL